VLIPVDNRDDIMFTIKLNLKQGLILVNSAPLMVDDTGVLNESIANICAPPIESNEGSTQYRLTGKAVVCGGSVDCLIRVSEGRVSAITFLFDLIEFFESSILESKILKSCEKSSEVKFMSDHPSTAFLDCDWGRAVFSYDARQGDLSLDIILKPKH
jgi:hypothetical protein